MNCSLCDAPLANGVLRCPACKHWNFGEVDESDVVRLSDAKLAKDVERIDLRFLNDVFGGGMARTSTNLVAGPPGAGKTTLFLQISDWVADLYPGRDVLYVACEQRPDEIATTARRIKTVHMDRICIVNALGGLKRTLNEYFHQYKPVLFILDSLTKLVGEDLEMAVKIAGALKNLMAASEEPTPCLIVNQINKSADHAGLMKLQHEVDGLFMLDKDDTTGVRTFYSTKNRFGEAPKGIELIMTPADAEIPGTLIAIEEEEE